MTEEMIKDYLEDSLEIQIYQKVEFGPVEVVGVKLLLNGKVISEDEVNLPDAD